MPRMTWRHCGSGAFVVARTSALPSSVAEQELQFFLGRVAQDLVEGDMEPEIPPGEEK